MMKLLLIIIGTLCALPITALADDLSDLRAALSASKDSGAFIRMNGVDVTEALRIEADAISDIDRRLKLLEVIEHDNLLHLKQMDSSK